MHVPGSPVDDTVHDVALPVPAPLEALPPFVGVEPAPVQHWMFAAPAQKPAVEVPPCAVHAPVSMHVPASPVVVTMQLGVGAGPALPPTGETKPLMVIPMIAGLSPTTPAYAGEFRITWDVLENAASELPLPAQSPLSVSIVPFEFTWTTMATWSA